MALVDAFARTSNSMVDLWMDFFTCKHSFMFQDLSKCPTKLLFSSTDGPSAMVHLIAHLIADVIAELIILCLRPHDSSRGEQVERGVLIPHPGNRCQDGSRINTLLHAQHINNAQDTVVFVGLFWSASVAHVFKIHKYLGVILYSIVYSGLCALHIEDDVNSEPIQCTLNVHNVYYMICVRKTRTSNSWSACVQRGMSVWV